MTINTAGNYVIQNNINMTNSTTDCQQNIACILINTSDVHLDMNGYSVVDTPITVGCDYGIYNYAPNTSNIEIWDGIIADFDVSQVAIVDVNTGDYHNLTLIAYGGGDGIRMLNPLQYNIQIRDNFIETQDYGIQGVCMDNCNIVNNVIKSFEGVEIQGWGWIVEKNDIGTYTDNSGSSTPCSRSEAYVDYSIDCIGCVDSIIRDNFILSDVGFRVTSSSHNVLVQLNDFFMPSIGDVVPATYDSSTYNNTFCGNRVCEVSLTIEDGTCWYERICDEAGSYVADYGVGNSIMNACVGDCIPSFYCDGNDKVFINSNCVISGRVTCEWGCEDGACIGDELPYPPVTTTLPSMSDEYNITWTDPIINSTEAQEVQLGWILPFFTPFFFAIMFMFGIAGALAHWSKSPMIGAIAIVVLIVMYSYIGIFPVWVTILMIVLAGIFLAMKFKDVFA